MNSYLADFPFSAACTFALVEKLDFFFASLLLGNDAETGILLSGFASRRNVVSMTEKVRIKSIAETCRVTVVEVMERGNDDDDDDEEEETGPSKWQMEATRVYQRTIQLLGDELGQQGELPE